MLFCVFKVKLWISLINLLRLVGGRRCDMRYLGDSEDLRSEMTNAKKRSSLVYYSDNRTRQIRSLSFGSIEFSSKSL